MFPKPVKRRVEDPKVSREKVLCETCNQWMSSRSALNVHYSQKHITRRLTCNQCGKKMITKQKLNEHMLVEHEGYKTLCLHCPPGPKREIARNDYLKSHIRKVHPEKGFVIGTDGTHYDLGDKKAAPAAMFSPAHQGSLSEKKKKVSGKKVSEDMTYIKWVDAGRKPKVLLNRLPQSCTSKQDKETSPNITGLDPQLEAEQFKMPKVPFSQVFHSRVQGLRKKQKQESQICQDPLEKAQDRPSVDHKGMGEDHLQLEISAGTLEQPQVSIKTKSDIQGFKKRLCN